MVTLLVASHLQARLRCGDESDALEGLTVLVAHRGVENFAFSVLEYHNLRFMVLVLGPTGAWILAVETWVP